MVKYSHDPLSATFQALADPTRRAILARLARGEATVTEVAAPFRMSLPAVSKHLGVLENAGLIHRAQSGRIRRCHLEAGPMRQAARWIDDYRVFWEIQLDQLGRFLEDTESSEQPTKEETDGTGNDAG